MEQIPIGGPAPDNVVPLRPSEPAVPTEVSGAAEAAPETEVAALCSTRVRDAIGRRNIELCRWSDLY